LRSAGYDDVVLVEFPVEEVEAVGFVTNEVPRSAREATNQNRYTVSLPNSPNPTAGTLTLVPTADVSEVERSVRRGFRLLVTTGLSVDGVDELPPRVAE